MLRSFLYLTWHELGKLLPQVSLWGPLLLLSAMGFWSVGQGFLAFASPDGARLFWKGWLAFSTVSGASLVAFRTFAALAGSPLLYWASLPLPLGLVLAAKLLAGVLLGTGISALSHALALRELPALGDVFTLLWVAMAVVGLVALLGFFVENLAHLSGLSLILNVFLQYLSAVYLPLERFPAWLQPVVSINPITLGAQALRGGSPWPILLLSVSLFCLGTSLLARKARRLLEPT